jgi:hypothetical protein
LSHYWAIEHVEPVYRERQKEADETTIGLNPRYVIAARPLEGPGGASRALSRPLIGKAKITKQCDPRPARAYVLP